jgi:hypothetical protein
MHTKHKILLDESNAPFESWSCMKFVPCVTINMIESIQMVHIKGILKLILVIFCISWKLAIGSINDIYETLTRFLSMKLCKSDIIRWQFCHILRSLPWIEFLLPGQQFISTLLSDILTILGIIWACKVFLDCFYN